MKYRTDFVTNSSSTSFGGALSGIIAALLAALGLGSCGQASDPDPTDEPATYRLEVSPSRLRLKAGASAGIGITVYKSDPKLGETVAESAVISPQVSAGSLSISPDSGQGQMSLDVQVEEDAEFGDAEITIDAHADGKTLTKLVTVEIEPDIELELTYPVGPSPKVFVTGWLFGARCVLNPGKDSEKDMSEEVSWSGSGSFEPATGSQSRPTFNGPGGNTIVLGCQMNGKEFKKQFKVEAVSTSGYARVGDKAKVEADAHGCPACPHTCIGPIIAGSSLVLIGGVPAARKGDPGMHAACCGPNTFVIAEGDHNVIIEGKMAARRGYFTQHCGGSGRIIEGAP
jgi:uncharacterized Zn-binding protein involved in type VI secretion